jgi:hypothetical protein
MSWLNGDSVFHKKLPGVVNDNRVEGLWPCWRIQVAGKLTVVVLPTTPRP